MEAKGIYVHSVSLAVLAEEAGGPTKTLMMWFRLPKRRESARAWFDLFLLET